MEGMLFVGLGGFFGASLRYLLGKAASSQSVIPAATENRQQRTLRTA